MNARLLKRRGLSFDTPWTFSIGCSPQNNAVPVAIIRKIENQPEVDAGRPPQTRPQPSLHRSWDKRRRRKWTIGGQVSLWAPSSKCVTAQAPPRHFSGTVLANQVEPNGIVRRGRLTKTQGVRGPEWGRQRPVREAPHSCRSGCNQDFPRAASLLTQPRRRRQGGKTGRLWTK